MAVKFDYQTTSGSHSARSLVYFIALTSFRRLSPVNHTPQYYVSTRGALERRDPARCLWSLPPVDETWRWIGSRRRTQRHEYVNADGGNRPGTEPKCFPAPVPIHKTFNCTLYSIYDIPVSI